MVRWLYEKSNADIFPVMFKVDEREKVREDGRAMPPEDKAVHSHMNLGIEFQV